MRVIEGGSLRSIMKFFVFYGEETSIKHPSLPNMHTVVARDETTARAFLPSDFHAVKVQVLKQTPKIGTPAGLLRPS
jgi:hypothetical protein